MKEGTGRNLDFDCFSKLENDSGRVMTSLSAGDSGDSVSPVECTNWMKSRGNSPAGLG